MALRTIWNKLLCDSKLLPSILRADAKYRSAIILLLIVGGSYLTSFFIPARLFIKMYFKMYLIKDSVCL